MTTPLKPKGNLSVAIVAMVMLSLNKYTVNSIMCKVYLFEVLELCENCCAHFLQMLRADQEADQANPILWHHLEHNGPVFVPPYVALPSTVHFYYDGKAMTLSQDAEEVATFYSHVTGQDPSREVFQRNFMRDWRAVRTKGQRNI